MNTSMTRLLAAVLALLLSAAACASDTGAQWTFAPVAVSEDASADETPTVGDDEVPVEAGDVLPPGALDPEAPAGQADEGTGLPDDLTAEDVEEGLTGDADPADPAADPAAEPDDGNGEPRVIEMHATAALQFTTPEGEQIRDIAVTPGETIVFRVDNTAGFDHNLYIGTEEQLVAPSATTDVGIPTWQSGVEELEWTVPDDVSGLKFGCTVPGHYALMQGTFSMAGGGEPSEPAATAEPGEPAASMAPMDHDPAADPAAEPDDGNGEPRVIEMHATAALQFTTPEGEQIRDIAVTPGETIVFRVDNTAGFDHNLYIGTEEQLVAPSATTDVGIPTWQSGVEELEWTVPDDVSGLKFGCTVPGHYALMQGTFSMAS